MSRRKLPAPPLILKPVFSRVRAGSSQAPRLLELAQFLASKGLLTDGGQMNLEAGLEGRGGVLSLTTQDVRSWAHSLVLDLTEANDPNEWSALTQVYSQRFDRGKPRRPTRLQRLYLEWSRDLGPLGLLEAAQQHSFLWSEIEEAVSFQTLDDHDRKLLDVILEFRGSGDWLAFQQNFLNQPRLQAELLRALPSLDAPSLESRLDWLSELARSRGRLDSEIILACRIPPGTDHSLPEPLVQTLFRLLDEHQGEVDPKWLGSLRFHRWPMAAVDLLDSRISRDDLIRRIVFGPRPGLNWLEQMLGELRLRCGH